MAMQKKIAVRSGLSLLCKGTTGGLKNNIAPSSKTNRSLVNVPFAPLNSALKPIHIFENICSLLVRVMSISLSGWKDFYKTTILGKIVFLRPPGGSFKMLNIILPGHFSSWNVMICSLLVKVLSISLSGWKDFYKATMLGKIVFLRPQVVVLKC